MKSWVKGNNLGKQWSLTKVMALQQVGPKKLTLPLKSEFITFVRHSGTPKRDDQHSYMSWFPDKIPGKAALLAVIPETCLFPLNGWPQELLSKGAKTGFEGNKLDKQFPSISEMALQQEEPIMLNWPLTSEPKTWVRHPGMPTRDDKHCLFAPESPPAPRFGNNLVICGNNPDISDNPGICDNLGIWGNSGVCGNWASLVGTNIAKHAYIKMRAILCDLYAMVVIKKDKLVVCVTIGLSMVLEDSWG